MAGQEFSDHADRRPADSAEYRSESAEWRSRDRLENPGTPERPARGSSVSEDAAFHAIVDGLSAEPRRSGGRSDGAPSLSSEARESACDPVFRHGVVVGFDGTLASERALAYAAGMAQRSGCGLIVVHVANRLPTTVWAGCEPPVFVDVPDRRTELLGVELACAGNLREIPWILVERGGDICHELEEAGREYEANAIVVGSTQGFLSRLFGSVAGRLAKRAQRPVVTVP